MLQWFRSRARVHAAAALVSLEALTLGSAAPHADDCHDAVCPSFTVPHDPSAHSIESATTHTDRPLHCVLCHWTRVVRPSTETAQHMAPCVASDVRPCVEIFSAPQFVSAAQPPLRAPPSSPSLFV
jgi:hypothetical protein